MKCVCSRHVDVGPDTHSHCTRWQCLFRKALQKPLSVTLVLRNPFGRLIRVSWQRLLTADGPPCLLLWLTILRKVTTEPVWRGREETTLSATAHPAVIISPCQARQKGPALINTEHVTTKQPFDLGIGRGDTYEDRTTATASLSTLSPKSRAYRSTSTCSSLKMARTVTGYRKNILVATGLAEI